MSAPFRKLSAYVTQRQLRANFPRSVFNKMDSIRVEHEGVVADVEIRRITSHIEAGFRTALGCPSCGRNCYALGVVNNAWRCCVQGCGGWTGRYRVMPEYHRQKL